MTVIGILGAGQLGRMLALAGYPLGLRFAFFDETADAPAGLGDLTVVAGTTLPRSMLSRIASTS
jgi:phosphoribosylaminoimidazole carboxylase (NCAIR synthetase)